MTQISGEIPQTVPQIIYGETVAGAYTEFAGNPLELAARMATEYGLSDGEISRTIITFDAKKRVLTRGSAEGGHRAYKMSKALRGQPTDTVNIKVGLLGIDQSRLPLEEVEEVLSHELTHARQIHHKERSLHAGVAMQMIGLLGGLITLPVATNSVFEHVYDYAAQPVGFNIAWGIVGSISGYLAAYKLATHERQARKMEKENPCKGTLFGVENPDYESRKESVERKDRERTEKLPQDLAVIRSKGAGT